MCINLHLFVVLLNVVYCNLKYCNVHCVALVVGANAVPHEGFALAHKTPLRIHLGWLLPATTATTATPATSAFALLAPATATNILAPATVRLDKGLCLWNLVCLKRLAHRKLALFVALELIGPKCFNQHHSSRVIFVRFQTPAILNFSHDNLQCLLTCECFN